jgi:hypothetical protein
MREMPGRSVHHVRQFLTSSAVSHSTLRDRLMAIAFLTVIVDGIGTLLVVAFEKGAARSDIHTVGDAAFWTTTQLLTVSSQLSNPVTTGGKIVDVALELWAIAVVTTVAGAWGSFFHRRSMEQHPMDRPRSSER